MMPSGKVFQSHFLRNIKVNIILTLISVKNLENFEKMFSVIIIAFSNNVSFS